MIIEGMYIPAPRRISKIRVIGRWAMTIVAGMVLISGIIFILWTTQAVHSVCDTTSALPWLVCE